MMMINDSSSKTASSPLHVGILLGSLLAVMVVLMIASYCTSRLSRLSVLPRNDNNPTVEGGGSVPSTVVIDEAVLERFPKLPYSQAKLRINEGNCSVCLEDYIESDVLRLLPDCGHAFHLKCVDPWLRLRPTCPLCRSSPDVVTASRDELV
ncbi:hypothetical protein TIFTF001_036887 [Ficus carica]|uniref:RING-type domain-containing protein n=1 Tax=Ficus carica TaxID=3494 RepID=A0AA88E481_FICCA|nr:hypothetical protein TIFTF001_036873 [Ficus carica]GMN67817.1 hypothetical protein TIFTF001_036877 [Ficus carica]GMN67822.1 hypothetical protein TIFTF001_036883 [Ficus carica]GMN67827.1 hypothetical protein TIFTF001_036887 [Ficus carica]